MRLNTGRPNKRGHASVNYFGRLADNLASSKQTKAQASIEYLYVLVFLVGFIVAVVIPTVKEAELSIAIASVRLAITGYEAENPDYFVTTLDYSVQENKVMLKPVVRSRDDGSNVPVPDALKNKIISRLKPIAPKLGPDNCAKASNYEYCVSTA
ncbi:hypothetical protein HZC09_04480 [Candidatus Micrarchaeota archaeon]|nr:hypothetical protein [Candidatus Micrarchaeota archaeon]